MIHSVHEPMLFENWRKSRDLISHTLQQFCDSVEAEGSGHPNPGYVAITKFLTTEMRNVLSNEDLRGSCDKMRVPCEIGELRDESLLKDLCLAAGASVLANFDAPNNVPLARHCFRVSFWKRLCSVVACSDGEVKLARLSLFIHLSKFIRTQHALERTFLDPILLYTPEFKPDLIQDTRLKLVSSSNFIAQIKAIVNQVVGKKIEHLSDDMISKFIESCNIHFIDHPDCNLLGFTGPNRVFINHGYLEFAKSEIASACHPNHVDIFAQFQNAFLFGVMTRELMQTFMQSLFNDVNICTPKLFEKYGLDVNLHKEHREVGVLMELKLFHFLPNWLELFKHVDVEMARRIGSSLNRNIVEVLQPYASKYALEPAPNCLTFSFIYREKNALS